MCRCGSGRRSDGVRPTRSSSRPRGAVAERRERDSLGRRCPSAACGQARRGGWRQGPRLRLRSPPADGRRGGAAAWFPGVPPRHGGLPDPAPVADDPDAVRRRAAGVLPLQVLRRRPGRDPRRPERDPRAGRCDPPAARPERAGVAQLWIFVKQIVSFDWGKSWATNEPVGAMFATRLPATLTVMAPILVLDILLAIPIALGVAYVRGSLTDRAIMVVTTVALSISFLVYVIVGQYVFAFQLGWFPVQGWSDSVWTNLTRLRAAAGAARGAGRAGAADAAVPHLLPRRDRPGLRAHRARQGPDRAAHPAQARAAQRA